MQAIPDSNPDLVILDGISELVDAINVGKLAKGRSRTSHALSIELFLLHRVHIAPE